MNLRLRHIGLVGLLLCALSHAWFGHNLLHGHHHHDLGEASYSSASRGQADQLDSLLGAPALPTDIVLWNLQCQALWIATVEETESTFQSSHLLDLKQVPRPPPAFSFIV